MRKIPEHRANPTENSEGKKREAIKIKIPTFKQFEF